MRAPLSIGIVAPSSPVPTVEFELGLKKLAESGIQPIVDPGYKKKYLFFAGNHKERAHSFYEVARSSHCHMIWCAPGGYGASHLLPHLDQLTETQGSPNKKLLIGFSDSTALFEYVRERWNWNCLHAPMPGQRNFLLQSATEWRAMLQVLSNHPGPPLFRRPLRFLSSAPINSIEAPLLGGNLTVLASLVGTPYLGDYSGKFLFLEDIHESLSRIDRCIQQFELSGFFQNIRGIILGGFSECRDPVPQVLQSIPSPRRLHNAVRSPKNNELRPLRPQVGQKKFFQEIFKPLSEKYGFPIAYGLPVGHGPGNQTPLPLNVSYTLTPDGHFHLSDSDQIFDFS